MDSPAKPGRNAQSVEGGSQIVSFELHPVFIIVLTIEKEGRLSSGALPPVFCEEDSSVSGRCVISVASGENVFPDRLVSLRRDFALFVCPSVRCQGRVKTAKRACRRHLSCPRFPLASQGLPAGGWKLPSLEEYREHCSRTWKRWCIPANHTKTGTCSSSPRNSRGVR